MIDEKSMKARALLLADKRNLTHEEKGERAMIYDMLKEKLLNPKGKAVEVAPIKKRSKPSKPSKIEYPKIDLGMDSFMRSKEIKTTV